MSAFERDGLCLAPLPVAEDGKGVLVVGYRLTLNRQHRIDSEVEGGKEQGVPSGEVSPLVSDLVGR